MILPRANENAVHFRSLKYKTSLQVSGVLFVGSVKKRGFPHKEVYYGK
jgi:hypothetical protein